MSNSNTVNLEVTNDYVFKKIFGKAGNEDILKDLLISILDIPIEKIEVMKDVYLDRDLKDNKLGILDIKATLNDNTIANIEMQVENEHNMIDRSLYYWANLYSNNLYKKQDYIENKKTIVINIMLFNVFKEGPYHERCKIRRDYNLEILTDELEMHFIQLPKCKKEDVKTKLDQWMQFIGNLSKEGVEKAMKENKEIKKAQEELEYLTGDEAERRLAFLREKKIRDDISNINGARREGKAEGETKSKIEIATKMLQKNMSMDEIIEITGLPKEEIEKLKK